MKLNDFSGGLNTRVDPSLLLPIQAQIYENIDNSKGSLGPIKDNTLDMSNIEKYFKWYEFGQEYIHSVNESSYIEYQDIMYQTHLGSTPTKYDGTNTYGLGIVGPTNQLSTIEDIAGTLDGTYTYVYTYYNSATGVESQPSELSQELAVSLKKVNVGGFVVSTDPQVDFIRLYRLGGTITSYTLVVEKANDAIDYLDNIADVDLAGSHILDSYTYREAPNELKYIKESYAMLFGAVGDKLYYSEIGKPDAWPVTNYIDFDKDITGIAMIQSGILVFTKFKTYIITGTSPDTFSRFLFDGEQGCLSHYTIKFTNNSLIWLSSDGICNTSGGLIDVISLPLLGPLSLSGVNNAEVLNRAYYLSHSEGILVFDFRYNTIVRTISTNVDWLDKHNDLLFSNISGDTYSMFTSDELLEYHYKSPILTEGAFSNLKSYKDFYIRYNGEINIKLYIDGKEVNVKELTEDECYNLKASSNSSGYGLEIEVVGTGIVNEIEYKAEGRQNGR